MTNPQATILQGGRLHLHHGPIDLIIGVYGDERNAAFGRATDRFQTILTELVGELDALRRHAPNRHFRGTIAQRMARATDPFAVSTFVTPMAAVAGAVAEEILGAAVKDSKIAKAYVNNGGDIAYHLGAGQSVKALGPAGSIRITSDDTSRGMATSGWRGRSQSLGIADAVTVIARTASMADVAATMIANAVDLPGHPAITRRPAAEIEVAHELGDRPVTTDVKDLSPDDVRAALDRGAHFARDCLSKGLIDGVVLALAGETAVCNEKPGRKTAGHLAKSEASYLL